MNAKSLFARIAALAEILLVLALGNIVGVALYDFLVTAEIAARADGVQAALHGGLRIFLRIGCVAAFGLALLWFRRGIRPAATGLTLANKPLGSLIATGVVLGAVSSLLISMVFAVHTLIPLGEGLTAWDELRRSRLDAAFYVELLATSVIVPPLVEEIMARGYMRVRLVESYGVTGGVVLAGLVFALAHGKFISTDPLLAIFMVLLIVNSVSWTYLAQTSGSLVPPMVAHAMTNTIATVVLFNVWVPLAFTGALILWQREAIGTTIREFANAWRNDPDLAGMWSGIVLLVAVIAGLVTGMSQFGRMPTLLLFGSVALLVFLVNLVRERQG